MRPIFLIGMLCGVMITAAMTFALAIPANNDHWRVEITKRGGGTWYYDTTGHLGWMWTVEPTSGAPQKKQIIVPASRINRLTQRL